MNFKQRVPCFDAWKWDGMGGGVGGFKRRPKLRAQHTHACEGRNI